MTSSAWQPLHEALDAGPAGTPPVRFWLRDDDAVTVTPALERLGRLCAEAGAPLLLACIPAGLRPDLAGWAATHPLVTPCQHGFAHRNHAAVGERACELGGARDDAVVLADLDRGRDGMDRTFGTAWMPLLVPPWNRIRPSLLPHLGALGITALSTFADSAVSNSTALRVLDCDLDIINWRAGRQGRSIPDLCGRLVGLVAAARATGRPIGLLTHHLAHDAAAWAFLDGLLPLVAGHPNAIFTTAAAGLGAR